MFNIYTKEGSGLFKETWLKSMVVNAFNTLQTFSESPTKGLSAEWKARTQDSLTATCHHVQTAV